MSKTFNPSLRHFSIFNLFQLDTPEWKHVSSTGKDLVLKMLSPNPINRPTISEILEHPWIRVSYTPIWSTVWPTRSDPYGEPNFNDSYFLCPNHHHCWFTSSSNTIEKDRDKLQRNHLGDTVEELKRYNARRKLKGAVQAVAGGVALDPLCCADTDSSKFRVFFFWLSFCVVVECVAYFRLRMCKSIISVQSMLSIYFESLQGSLDCEMIIPCVVG